MADPSPATKVSLATKVRTWSKGRLVNSVTAVVLAVGLLVGFGLGFKVEQSRIKTKNRSQKKTTTAHTTTTPAVRTPVPPVASTADSAIGRVSASTAKVVTVKPVKGPAISFAFWQGNLIVKARRGKASDVAAGVRMVYKPGATVTTAKEIVVLRGPLAKMGSLVTAATPTSMTFNYVGTSLTVNTSGAVVDTVTPATRAAVTNGAKVIAQGARIKAGLLLSEMVVLPSKSAFG